MKKEVLGIKVDDINISQATEIIVGWLKGKGKHFIVTPNPEIVVMAQEDMQLKRIINQADLSIPDGVGLKLLTDVVCYTPGVDLMEEVIRQSLDYGFTIGLLGGQRGIAEKTAECLRKKYPKIRITYTDSGGIIDENGEIIGEVLSSKYYVSSIKSKKIHNTKYIIPNTDILFVAFGPPKQEKWIEQNLKNIPVKVAMGVGGSFDYLSGEVIRAPMLLRNLGLEWLFRLVIQPWRIKRQLRLIKFLWLLAKR